LDHGLHVLNPKPKYSRAAFWRIFSSNKSAPANKKTGFYENRDPSDQETKRIKGQAFFLLLKLKVESNGKQGGDC
jgi:hypothetical protein